jgi:anti-sigma B factor antagonist
MADHSTGHSTGDDAGHSESQPRFEVEPGSAERPAIVRAAGDIDLASAARFQAALTEAGASSGDITADLTAVTYCDSAAIHALFTAARHQSLTLIVPETGPITTMLKVAGLDEVCTVRTVP